MGEQGRGGGKTYPLKIKHNENSRLPTFPAVSAVSIPATTRCVNVPANITKLHRNKNISPPRSVTASVG